MMMGVRNLSVFTLILYILLLGFHNCLSLENSDSYEDVIQEAIDNMVQDLTEKYSTIEPDDFWHPYVYGTGNENREIIHVEKVNKTSIGGNYFQWKHARLGLKHYLVGLSKNSIDLFGSDFRKVSSLAVEIGTSFEALAVYTRWNDEHNHAELIIIAVTSEPRLNVYQLEDGRIESIGSFPLHYAVREIEFCHVGSSTKIIVIPRDEEFEIDIYNVETTNTSHVWFFQRLLEAGSPDVVVYDSDMLESVIAVASDTKIDIYTYESKAGLYDVYQSVSIPSPCRRLFSFTLAYQHYIGCVPVDLVSSVRFISYNYNTNEYSLEENTFGNITAVEVYPVAVADYRDEYLLVVQDQGGVTHIMSYHGVQVGFAVEYSCNQEDGCPPLVDLRGGVGFRYNEYTAYVFPSDENAQQSEVLLISKEVRDSTSPLLDQSRNQYNTFKELSKRFADWEKGVIGVQDRVNKRVLENSPNTITGDWRLNSLSGSLVKFEDQIYGEAYIGSTSREVFKNFKFVDVIWTEEDFSTQTSNLTTGLRKFSTNVELASTQLIDAVLVNFEYDQLVTATQSVSGRLQSKVLSAGSIVVPFIDDYKKTEEFLANLAQTSNKLNIKGSLTFDESVEVSDTHTSEINEIYVADIVRLSQENIFECPLQFYNNLTVNGSISAKTVNGINLLQEIVTPYNFSGFNFLNGIVIRNDTQTHKSYNFGRVLLRSSSQIVSTHVYFPHLNVTTSATVHIIDGYDFSKFSSSVITKRYPGKIIGAKIVSKINAGSLNINNFWNHVRFPDGFVHSSQKNIVLNSKKDFSYLTTSKAYVSGLLDGYEVDSFVSRSSSMDLSNHWVFKGYSTIINDINVTGLVDGVYMEDLMRRGTLDQHREPYIANADVVFENDVIFDILLIKSQINDMDYEAAFGNLVLFNGPHCKIPGLTTIRTNLTLDNLQIDSGLVNDLSLDGFFCTTRDQNITGKMKIDKSCQFSSLYSLKQYDTVNLKNLLDNAVRLTGENNIPWRTHFEHINCGNSMVIDNSINGVSEYGKIVSVTSGRESQKFLYAISISKFVLGTLEVYEDLVLSENKKLAGLDVQKWNSERLRLSSDVQIPFRFEIEGLVKASSDVYATEINGVLLSYLSNYTFRTDNPNQVFTEYVSSNYEVKVHGGNIDFEKYISGYSLNDIAKYALPLNATEDGWLQLRGNWHFQSIQISKNLTVYGNTCGVDLRFLKADSVYRKESRIIFKGEKAFSEIQIQKDIIAHSINGNINFDKLFNLHERQTISCPFHFFKNVTVDGKLITDGNFNDVSIGELIDAYSYTDGNVHTVHGDYTSAYNITTDLLYVDGYIQDRSFSGYIETLIRTEDSYQQFTAKKTFSNPVTIHHDAQVDFYNNIELEHFRTLLLYDDLKIDYSINFKGLVEVDTLEISSGDVSANEIIGVDWNTLRYSIPLESQSTSNRLKNLKFDNVLVEKYLTAKNFQGFPFDHYVTLNEAQDVASLKINKAKFHGSDVPVDGLISGVQLSKEFEDTLMSNVEYQPIIGGTKYFRGSVRINEDFTCFHEIFKHNIVDTTKDFTISSPIEFEKAVYIDGEVNVKEPLHGHSIESIISEALTQDNDQPITGEWEFVGGITFKEDVRGPGELQNFDIQGLIDKKNSEIEAAARQITVQKQKYQETCYKVYNLTEGMLSNPMKLDAFDRHQSIILRKQVEKVITLSAAGKLYLLTASSSCEIGKYEWKPIPELFYKEHEVPEKQLHLGHVQEWYTVNQEDSGLLIFLTQPSPCSILENGIHFLRLDPYGTFSSVFPVLTEEIRAFKVISLPVARKTAIFILNGKNELKILAWAESQSNFVIENEIALGSAYDRLELSQYIHGTGVLVCSESEVAVFYYNWNAQELSLIGKDDFLTGTGSLALFENYDTLYAVVPKKTNGLSSLQSSCTMQVFRAYGGEIHQFHQLDLQDLVSLTVIDLSNQIYISFLSKTFGLSIYKFKGLNGLEPINLNPIKIFNGYQVYSFDVTPFSYNSNRPFLLVLTAKTIEVYHSYVHGDSLTLNSKSLCRVM